MSARRPNGVSIQAGSRIRFSYVNYRMEKSEREAIVLAIFYGTTEYHPDKQWFIRAHDLEKEAMREFAMKDMTNVQVVS